MRTLGIKTLLLILTFACMLAQGCNMAGTSLENHIQFYQGPARDLNSIAVIRGGPIKWVVYLGHPNSELRAIDQTAIEQSDWKMTGRFFYGVEPGVHKLTCVTRQYVPSYSGNQRTYVPVYFDEVDVEFATEAGYVYTAIHDVEAFEDVGEVVSRSAGWTIRRVRHEVVSENY